MSGGDGDDGDAGGVGGDGGGSSSSSRISFFPMSVYHNPWFTKTLYYVQTS